MPQRVLIIGAGWSGIAAARTYLQINPFISLTILDSDTSFGGIWSASRIYPGLVVDSPRGTYEFSDMSMCSTPLHPPYGEISGEEVHVYIEKYTEKWDLRRRTHFGVTVAAIRRQTSEEEGWVVESDKGEVFECEKLIVATGMFSIPHIPELPGSNDFRGPLFHTRLLGEDYHRLQARNVKNVAVIGGQKSAIETALICLNAGKTVHWIIRESGNGPAPIILKDTTPSKWNAAALAKTKLFAQLCPSIYNRTGWWYRILHSGVSTVGFGFTKWLWNRVRPPGPDYNASANAKKIKPTLDSFFWSSTPPAFLRKDSPFWKALHGGEKLLVYRSEAVSLSEDRLQLSNGNAIPVDAIVFATGWQRANSNLFSHDDCLELGLPIPFSSEPKEITERWAKLDAAADDAMESMFPMLVHPPAHRKIPAETTPYRLHRHIISPSLVVKRDRSITFLSLAGSAHTVTYAELSALWAVAWMESLHTPACDSLILAQPTNEQDALDSDVALTNAFIRHRYLSSGRRSPAFITEAQTIFDTLVRDLGLEVDRRRKGWFGVVREYLTPYENSDYAGVVYEVLARRIKKL